MAEGVGAEGTIGTRAVGNAAMLLAVRIVSRLIALVTVFAAANALGASGNGRFQTAVTYTALISIIIDLGFNTLYVREGARAPDQIPYFLRNIISTRAIFAVPALLVLAVVMRLSGLQSLLFAAFAVMLLSAYSNILRSTFYATGRLSYEAVAILAESLVLLAGTLYGVRAHRGPEFFLWAYAAAYGFSVVYFVAVIASRRMATFGWEFDPGFLLSWFRRSLPFALTFVITTLYFKIDVPILLHFRSFTEVGWYTFAYKPIESLLFIPVTILNVAFPVLSVYHRESPERLADATSRFYRVLLLLGWPISIGTVMLASGVNAIFDRSGGYGPAAAALQVLGAGVFLMFVTNAFIAALNSMDRQALFLWAAMTSLVVNVLLNLLLVPRFGYLGAAWATNLTELALLVVGWILVRRVLAPIPIFSLSWRILLAGIAMAVPLSIFQSARGPLVGVAILVGMLVYGAALLLLRAFEPAEIDLVRRALRRRPGA
ncbi:MAG: polysaccharide biosynthesis C-terminal domain-containing protein [Candidatus Dormibacteraceae bacterium]